MSNILSQNWQYSTLSLEDDLGHLVGTGFLVADTPTTQDERWGQMHVSWERPLSRAYLVTARHVLGANASEISCTISYGLRYNAHASESFASRQREFVIRNDPPNWAIHPDPGVDVAALDVTDWIAAAPDAHLRFCPLSEIANAISLLDVDGDSGDDVFVLGYPLRLRQGSTNLPIVRKGVLASSPRRSLIGDRGTHIRGFLVDGAIMPGSSGSPVISASTRFHRGDLATTAHRTLLLGVVAQEWGRGELSRYDATSGRAPDVPIEGYANLGFAHSAATVIETLLAFKHFTLENFLKLDHDQHWAPQLGVPEWSLELDGREVDSRTFQQVTLRLHRDRMRARGHKVEPDEFSDALSLMGPPDVPLLPGVKPQPTLGDRFRGKV